MARLAQADSVYSTADLFRDRCLRAETSLFWPEHAVWTIENIDRLLEAHMARSDNGTNWSFQEWKSQLADEPENVHRLAVDVLALYYLFLYGQKQDTKVGKLRTVIGWKIVDLPPEFGQITEAYTNGVATTGAPYLVKMHEQITYYLEFAKRIKRQSIDPNDRPRVQEVAEQTLQTVQLGKPARHVLLHLLFPDYYERIASHGGKQRIAESFKDVADKAADIDEHLYGIRRALESSGEYSWVDFYDVPEISKRWRGDPSGETQAPPTTAPVKPRSDSSSLARLAGELLVDVEELEQIEHLLKDRRQLIFYGPPGTGKTYLAKALAEFFTINPEDRSKDGKVKIVQFHPSYAYEDFVQGYRPRQGENGEMQFKLVDGPLMEIAEAARSQPETMHVLIIDEINRGNVAKVLGELYFLLEYRKETITLQYSSEGFLLPENLWIIGTMNTADRSIALIDAALRRRFYFTPFFPDKEPIKGLLHRYLERKQPEMLWVADVVDRANELLGDRHGAIGPSYFMKENLDEEWIERIWKYAIMPYLEEQFFGEKDRLDDFALDRLLGMTNGSTETADADAPPQSE